MMKKSFYLVFCVGLFMYSVTAFAQKTVSIESLLKEMVDHNERAKFPDPAFTNKQFSSYDRESVAKDEPGWFANYDCSMFLRVDKDKGRNEFVLMDTEGPGAVVRFWMTGGGNGILRIYIDDYDEPTIVDTAFHILSGTAIAAAP